MIEVCSLTKVFAGTVAVDRVSFSVRPGEILGMLGPNGAGKTTTMRIICGYVDATDGEVRVCGHDVGEASLEARARIGYLPEGVPLYAEMRVGEYLRYRAGIKRVPSRDLPRRIPEVLEQCGLQDSAKAVIGSLSRGFRQRVGLADALVASPSVLVLDEPTSGLDPNQVVEIRKVIRGLADEHTVLFSSHVLSEVEEISDRVVIFHHGRLVAEDSIDALKSMSSTHATTTIEVARKHCSALPQMIQGLAEVVEKRDLDEQWTRWTLRSDTDPRLVLFERASERGIPLRELTRRHLTLEEVFRKLTDASAGAVDR